MTDLIYSRADHNGELTLEEIQTRAPAAFASDPIEGVSDRYGHYQTSNLIEMMRDYGFVPVQAAQKKPRKKERMQHAEHFLAFSRERDLIVEEKSGRPEIVIYNSSDRTSAAKIYAGYFRSICSNSLVAGEGFQSKIYHGKNAIFSFEDMLKEMLQRLPLMGDLMHQMQIQHLGEKGIEKFARRALELRWDSWEKNIKDITPASGSFYDVNSVWDMMRRRRRGEEHASNGLSVWETFNRAQEGVIRGSLDHIISHKAATEEQPGEIKLRSPRPINNVKKSIELNRKLWDLAVETVS